MGKDPAFLYYDADAARDVSHMNRLERGCYFDIIQAQKKFGRLTKEAITKILGRDFGECWVSIEMVLTLEDGKYFIEWLENSIEKRKAFTASRKKNREGGKKKDQDDPKTPLSSTYVEHMIDICETSDSHMVNENENVIEEVKETVEVKKPPRPKTPKKIASLFIDSDFVDKDKFYAAFKDTAYEIFNLEFYYESVMEWSNSKNEKRADWIATTRTFMLRDKKDNKIVYADNTKPYGQSATDKRFSNTKQGPGLNATYKQFVESKVQRNSGNGIHDTNGGC